MRDTTNNNNTAAAALSAMPSKRTCRVCHSDESIVSSISKATRVRHWAAQVEPRVLTVDPTLAFRHFQGLSALLKPKHDKLLSNIACFGFKCKVRPCTKVCATCMRADHLTLQDGRVVGRAQLQVHPS